MFKKLKIKSVFLISLFIIVVLISAYGILLISSVRTTLEESLITRGKNEIATLTHIQTIRHVQKDIFFEQDVAKTQAVFNEFFKEIDTEEILRIKVWDRNARIIAANDPTIVGATFADNTQFIRAMTGEVMVTIKEPLGNEGAAEMGYGQLMEVYVPITYDDGEIIGVIETYTILDNLNTQITHSQKKLLFKIVGISVPLILLISILFFILYRSMYSRIHTLIIHMRTIGSGNLENKIAITSNDEISEIATAINNMTEALNTSLVTKSELEKEVHNRTEELHKKMQEMENLNKFMTDRELKMIELKEEIAKLKSEQK